MNILAALVTPEKVCAPKAEVRRGWPLNSVVRCHSPTWKRCGTIQIASRCDLCPRPRKI
jgi:hypothetical protein